MLTRLEVDGFKNLLGFSADFGLSNCVAGPNAVGKSNLFDAIEFLSLLAELPVKEAAKRVRGADRDIRDLLWTDGQTRADTITLAAEMILPARVRDPLGGEADVDPNVVRYQVRLRYLPSDDTSITGQLVVVDEDITQLSKTHLKDQPRFPKQDSLLDVRVAEALATGVIGHVVDGAVTSISLQTAISGDPISYAIRQELRSWRRLALEPEAMRALATFDEVDEALGADGSRLASMDSHTPSVTVSWTPRLSMRSSPAGSRP